MWTRSRNRCVQVHTEMHALAALVAFVAFGALPWPPFWVMRGLWCYSVLVCSYAGLLATSIMVPVLAWALYLPMRNPRVLLGLELSLGLFSIVWLWYWRGYYRVDKVPLTRAQRRHPLMNVFVMGLSPRVVVLRMWCYPVDACTQLTPSCRCTCRRYYTLDPS